MTTETWRVIDTGYSDGFKNMAVDEAILLAYGEELVPPTLRFYGWRPAGLSLGYFQKIEEEVDLEACNRLGIDVVRRMTGGRAILHDVELTYSLVVDERNPLVSGNVVESYRKISMALVVGLRLLGLAVELSPEVSPAAVYHGGPVNNGSNAEALGSSACFDAPCSYELTLNGKKLVGSAQTRSRGLLLQHGSIMFDFDPHNLVATFKLPEEKKQDLAGKMAARAISLKEATGQVPDRARVIEALIAGFEKQFGVTMAAQDITDWERETAARLSQEKYQSRDWNYKR